MKNLRNYFVCFILLLLGACSTEPIETGPFAPYQCPLDGRVYQYKFEYDIYCNEDTARKNRQRDSLMRVLELQRVVKKNCKIDNVRLESEYRCETEWREVRILFDSVTYHHLHGKYSYNNGFYVEVSYGEKEYNCPDLLPAGVDSVFADSTCSDTLGIQAIIDVFANFPDSLCEELPNQ